ncbi:MAG: isopeptide-forming domain-containing fimbrial protein, partial [Clostridiales Family XIII bacterium]|nr:isopeptide-forming domain-containing fimbrial protein [Clostridiales Family XIII bacterium]
MNIHRKDRYFSVVSKALAYIIILSMLITMAVPALGLSGSANPLNLGAQDGSTQPKFFHVDYTSGETVIKSVDIQIPDQASAARLPGEALPTEQELADSIGAESKVTGWIDISDLVKRNTEEAAAVAVTSAATSSEGAVEILARAKDDAKVYTKDEFLRLEMSENKVFEAVVEKEDAPAADQSTDEKPVDENVAQDSQDSQDSDVDASADVDKDANVDNNADADKAANADNDATENADTSANNDDTTSKDDAAQTAEEPAVDAPATDSATQAADAAKGTDTEKDNDAAKDAIAAVQKTLQSAANVQDNPLLSRLPIGALGADSSLSSLGVSPLALEGVYRSLQIGGERIGGTVNFPVYEPLRVQINQDGTQDVRIDNSGYGRYESNDGSDDDGDAEAVQQWFCKISNGWILHLYEGSNKWSVGLAGSSTDYRDQNPSCVTSYGVLDVPYNPRNDNPRTVKASYLVRYKGDSKKTLEIVMTYHLDKGSRQMPVSVEITNKTGKNFTNMSFIFGGDTYFAGEDYGVGFYNKLGNSVNVWKDASHGTMSLIGSAATPFDHWFHGPYYNGLRFSIDDNLTDPTAKSDYDPNGPDGKVDQGLWIGWTRANVASGTTTTFDYIEAWTEPTALQIIAPPGKTVPPGANVNYEFQLLNATANPITISTLELASQNKWKTSLTGPTTSITIPGGESVVVPTMVIVPDDAANGVTDNLTLTATVGGQKYTGTTTTKVDTSVPALNITKVGQTENDVTFKVDFLNISGTHNTTVRILDMDGNELKIPPSQLKNIASGAEFTFTSSALSKNTQYIAEADARTDIPYPARTTFQIDQTVIFDANGGVTPTPKSKSVIKGNPYGPLATTIRPGYKFDGWYTKKAGGTKVTDKTIVTEADDHTLYAHWSDMDTPTSFTKQVSTDGGKTYADDVRITDITKPLTYKVSVTMPTDMRGYATVVVNDILPEELIYTAGSGKIKVDGQDITADDSKGTLAYGSVTKTLSYTFKPAWLANETNLNSLAGKTIELTLNATIDASKVNDGLAKTITNKAQLILNGGDPTETTPPDAIVPNTPSGSTGAAHMTKTAKWTDKDAGKAAINFKAWGEAFTGGEDTIIVMDVSLNASNDLGTSTCPFDGATIPDTTTWQNVSGAKYKMSGAPGHAHEITMSLKAPGELNSSPYIPPFKHRVSAEKGIATYLINKIMSSDGNKVATVNMGVNAEIGLPWTNNKTEATQYITSFSKPNSQSSDYKKAWTQVETLLKQQPKGAHTNVVFMSTLYMSQEGRDYEAALNAVKNNYDTTIYVVALNPPDSSGNESTLYNMSSGNSTDGYYVKFPGIEKLENAKWTQMTGGPVSAGTGAKLTDVVDSKFKIVSTVPAEGNGVTIDRNTNTVTWTVGDLPVDGTSKDLIINVELKDNTDAGANFPTNVGNAKLDYKDHDGKNAKIEAETPILYRQNLKKVLSDGQDQGIKDSTKKVSYDISFTLPSDMKDHDSITIKDFVPSGMAIDTKNITVNASGTALNADITSQGTFASVTDPDTGITTVSYTVNKSASCWAKLAGEQILMNVKASFTNAPKVGDSFTNKAEFAINDEVLGKTDGETVEIVDVDEPASFTKQVSTDGGDTYTTNAAITDTDTELTYKISVTFPHDMNGYNEVAIADELPAELQYVTDSGIVSIGGVAIDLNDASIGALSFDKDTNRLTYTFAEDYDFASLADKTVELTLNAKIDKTALASGQSTTITNDAQLILNGGSDNPTYPTQPTPPAIVVPTIPSDFTKALADGQNPNIATSDVSKPVSYDISFTLPTDMTGYESIEVQDILPSGMAIKSPADVQVKVGGVTLGDSLYTFATKAGIGNDEGKTIISVQVKKDTVAESAWDSLAGKKIVMNVAAFFTGEPVIGETFTNVAKLLVNGDDVDKKDGPPIEISEIEQPPAFTKEVSTDGGNTYSENGAVITPGSVLTYRIKVKFPTDMNGYNMVGIEDQLPESLIYQNGSGHVSIDGTAVNDDDGRIVFTPSGIVGAAGGGTVTYLFADTYNLKSLSGKTAEFILDTRIDQDALAAHGATVIKNNANLILNDGKDDPEPPTPPEVIVPELPSDFAKTLADGQNPHIATSDVSKPVDYDISFTLPTDMDGYELIEIQDLLPSGMAIKEASDVSITVSGKALDASKYELTTNAAVGSEGTTIVSALIKKDSTDTFWNDFKGAEIVMNVNAFFTGTPSVDDEFTNTAKLLVNGDDVDEDDSVT